MIPRIKKIKDSFENNNKMVLWGVQSKWGIDVCNTFTMALRYWLWHCGVPAKIAFRGVKKHPYPLYFKTVCITYADRAEGAIKESLAWLAVDDDCHYIWTLEDNTTVILDKNVLLWRYED